MKLFAVVLLVFSAVIFGTFAQTNIKSTSILFRHGERTPAASIGILRNDVAEDIGFQQLTQRGSRQHYENGLYLRLRYLHLLPKDGFFRLTNMKILCSIPERTMMSLQSFMSGMLPPPLTDLTLPIYWQPFYFDVDHLAQVIAFEPTACNKYNNLYIDLNYNNNPADIASWLQQDQPIVDELSGLIGMQLSGFKMLVGMAEIVRANSAMGVYTPDRILEIHHSTLIKYMERYLELAHETEYMLTVRGGPLITQIVDNMEAVAQKSKAGRDFMIFSAHDMTVFSLANILGVKSQIPKLPNYADTILVDLVDNGGSELQVQASYVDNSKLLPNRYNLNIPGCGEACNLSTFKNIVSKYFVRDHASLCN